MKGKVCINSSILRKFSGLRIQSSVTEFQFPKCYFPNTMFKRKRNV